MGEIPERTESPPLHPSEDDLELRLSEEISEDDKDSSEIEEENKTKKKHAEPKGGSGMRSQKGKGASTREQTQAGGREPPGVERDHADMDYLPLHSTPLVKEKTFLKHRECSGEVTVRNAGQGRVTTTPGKPKSRSDVVTSGFKPLKKGSTIVDETPMRTETQLAEASGENKEENQESETPDSEEENYSARGRNEVEPEIHHENKEKDKKIYEAGRKRSQNQNQTLNKWSEKRLQQKPESDEKEKKREERRIQLKGRNEQQLWELKREKVRLDKERQVRKQARDERALVRLKQRDKIAQKAAKAASEEEMESRELGAKHNERETKEIQKKREASSSSES